MPSPEVEPILAEYQQNPGPVLVLPRGLTASDFAALNRAADVFGEVKELYIRSTDTDWTSGLMTFALRLKKLSRLNLSYSPDLSDIGLRFISDNLIALTALHLGDCRQVTDAGVTALADNLIALTALHLEGCRQVTDAGGTALADNLTGLTTLDLGGCDKVTDAGVTVLAHNLTGLTTLNLWGCDKVTDAGVTVLAHNLTGLTTLDLAFCDKVTDAGVTALAHNLIALTALDLRYCRQVTDAGVTALADNLTGLTTLNLGDCRQVTDAGVTALADNLTGLTTLNLWGCDKVTDAGVTVLAHNLTGLTTLNLRGCRQVTDAGVTALADNLTGLTTLDLAFCDKVTDAGVTALAHNLIALTTLNLEGCGKITALPESIGRLRNLGNLNVSGALLSALPVALQEFTRLRWLNVQNIPGLKLPEELTRHPENPRAILDYYFRTTTENRRTLNEAKLILVGNEAVGKTSLVNFLVTNKPCKDTLKTPGVKILGGVGVKGWDVNRDAAGEIPLRLNVWDFGGQQVLYETHQFFLTDRSLYLIVLSARKENETEQEANLIAWLRSIRTRTVLDVPVIVVINKSEPPQELHIDEARLKREFPSIKRFVRTSCRAELRGKGIDELRQTIVEVIQSELPHVREQFPVSYFNVKEELAKTARRASILNTNTYSEKCRTQHITDKREQENLLALLHRIGVVVKYDDTTLLDPNWLTTAVYRVLTHADVVRAGGEFSVGELGALLAGLPPKDYPPARWPFIAKMMERFGLSFRLPETTDRYLVPNQSHVAEPNLPGWDARGLLRFWYEYQDAPARGLLPRFVVRAHRLLTNPRIAWLNGVVLSVEGCEVLVKMEPHKRRLGVTVRGPEASRRSALAVVRGHFAAVHDLNNLAPRADMWAKIPVEISGQPDAAFDFDWLEALERDGTTHVPYPGTSARFEIKKLLAGVGPKPSAGRDSALEGGDVYHIHVDGNAHFNKARDIHKSHQEIRMGDEINIGGNVSGSALGREASVTAEQIITTHQQLPPNAPAAEELKEIVKAALAQLTSEKLGADDHKEATENVGRIEKELAKPAPNKDRVRGWVDAVEGISGVTGQLLRAAGSIIALFR